ncbi:NAD(P)H-dependent oxidoreductase [Mucilaginibacter sp.]|uniref:NAD(P)H-dependent oxidoreductase n=1 Tax=Mucilaginibacter sp. TaxID=1882438 RepID=UPI00261ED6D5|nr:NAD(P)H-dependent oxidoreductase [Mucilaginibacter sp.]MDB5032706.1 NAD(P)H-dependent oxidoreductase [Mucilaginibacter sp.]
MSILESLHWRYATKRMTGERVPQEKIDIILEAARMAPTSNGIQPFTILVITDKKLMEKIQPIAYNQPQITEASHLLVFAAWDTVTSEKVDYVFDQVIRERNLPADALTDYINQIKGMFSGFTPEEQFNWAAKQTYLAFGVATTAAAIEKIDATPMEGFVNSELDKLLGLREKGLRSVTMLPLGYRDTANDWLANMKKVRRPKEELILELN